MQELEESLYWIELLADAEIFPLNRLKSLMDEVDELSAILVTVVRNTKSK